jgi:chorismate mutase/prephenate dehydratase
MRVAADERLPRRSIRAVFEAVRESAADAGVVPGENVVEGSVNETLDLLLRHALVVSGEVVLPIQHCLIGRAGRAVARVYSHPQALAQCADWLEHHYPHAARVECFSTAEAASLAAADTAGAAIAGGARSGLDVLERGLGLSENKTRFFVISRAWAPSSGHDRTLLAFEAPHRPGALHACLGPFARAGINLCRLETRPAPAAAWTYRFIAEVEGHPSSPALVSVLEELGQYVRELRVLGAWPVTPDV